MAEILIKAEEPWQITDTGSRKGDVIVVRPDGWEWGNEECLPKFIVIKIDGSMEKHKHLEEGISKTITEEGKEPRSEVVKYRKNYIDLVDVEDVKGKVKDFVKITPHEYTKAIKAKV